MIIMFNKLGRWLSRDLPFKYLFKLPSVQEDAEQRIKRLEMEKYQSILTEIYYKHQINRVDEQLSYLFNKVEESK